MKRTKKMAAWALAAAMMLSSSMAVFASGSVTSGTGTVQGTGTSEGHVDKEVLNVVLPTVNASDPSAFAYTMDPERLIQGTDAAKYEEGVIFPAKDTDTGVYFLTAPNTYANTSKTYQVINKSSCDVTLTVDVQATASAGGKDIALATAANDITTATAPTLYLGLKVGNNDQAVSTTKATVTKTIAGSASNFEIGVNTKEDGTKEYTYREKANAASWKAMNISMTGSVNKKDIAADTTAPAVDVTWSWAKAADGATADTDAVDYVAGPQVTLSADGLITITGLTSTANVGNGATDILVGYADTAEDTTLYPVAANGVTWITDSWDSTAGGTLKVQLKAGTYNPFNGKSINVSVKLTDGKTITCSNTITTVAE